MECPDIDRLVLSEESIKAIRKIKRLPSLANALSGIMATSAIVNIFISPTPAAATLYSIHSTDWRCSARLMMSAPPLLKKGMWKVARDQWVNAQFRNNHAESQFWQAVAHGCSFH